jgi:hypothetical protein
VTTDQGRAKVAALIVDWLKGGTIVVTDGDVSASAPAELLVVDGTTVIATAVFDEQAANFHWRRRELHASDGVVLDALDEDLGEKVTGAIWTLEVPVEVAA